MKKMIVMLAVFGLIIGNSFAQGDKAKTQDDKANVKKAKGDEMEMFGKIFVFDDNGKKKFMIDAGDYGKLELPSGTMPKDIQNYVDKNVKMKIRLYSQLKRCTITEVFGIEEVKELPKKK